MKRSSFLFKLTIPLVILVTFGMSSKVVAQTFDIKGPNTLCRKGDYYKIEVGTDFPCDKDLVKWHLEDDNGDFQPLAGTGEQYLIIPDLFLSSNSTKRSVRLKASVSCDILDKDGEEVNIGFSEIKDIAIVDPAFFELRLTGTLDCSTNSFTLTLLDQAGLLTSSNLSGISWDLPSSWSITSGAGTHSIVINTNGNTEGVREVEVEYTAEMIKPLAAGGSIRKKCGDKSKIVASFDISSCKNHIAYTQVPGHPSSHSRIRTTFNGQISLPQNNYNYVAGGHIEISPGFSFMPSGAHNLNLFVENCTCGSPYHDPNNLGSSSFDQGESVMAKRAISGIPNQENGTYKSKAFNVSLFPNPFYDHFHIEGLPPVSEVKVQIMDQSFSLLKELKISTDNEGRLDIHPNLNNAGMYVVTLSYGSKINVIQVIKQ